MDYRSWRCSSDDRKFCPPEGCPKNLGCARKHGWQTGHVTPPEYQGYHAEMQERGDE